jgi:hypothetical protein
LTGEKINRAVLLNATREVENKAVYLIWEEAQAATNHLREQALRQRRPEKDDTINALRVKSFGVDVHVTDRPQFAGFEVAGNLLAI